MGNSLKKQKSLYKVLTPSIKTPIYILMGAHDAYINWRFIKFGNNLKLLQTDTARKPISKWVACSSAEITLAKIVQVCFE